MITTLIYILVAIFIILLNAFFVLGEFALVKVRHTRLLEIAKNGGYKEKLALHAQENIDNYLSSLQIGITMASLALGWVGEPSVGKLLSWLLPSVAPFLPESLLYTISFILSFLIITSMHVIFGEQVPKLFSIKFPEKSLLWVIVPLHYFYIITKVFRRILVAIAYKTLELFGINPHTEETPLSQEELRLMFSKSQEGGKFSLRRLMMFENLFDFEQVKVQEIMTPRENILALKKSNTWPENFAIIKKRKFSRFPLYENTIDDAREYVLIKEMSLEALNENSTQPIEEKYTYPILNLDESTPVEAALREFQANRNHQALVRNAKGEVVGLLTLEDVLEELVGEIRDEYDKPSTIKLSSFFLPKASTINLTSTEKYAAIDELLDAVYKERPLFAKEQARDFIRNREKLMSSALTKGVAFPHARVATLSTPMVAVGISKKGVLFDGNTVKIIFLILTPFKEPATQLKLLAELAGISSNKVVKERLLHSKSPAEIAEIFLDYENTIPD
ncbi:MAG: CNNM domain-containing protein [Elusimicrobiota bacterium]|jgi:CBS domain containing-hemolysin-like protein|nr:CNNM domain-containing protein [Elusimicrobiota bacterium]